MVLGAGKWVLIYSIGASRAVHFGAPPRWVIHCGGRTAWGERFGCAARVEIWRIGILLMYFWLAKRLSFFFFFFFFFFLQGGSNLHSANRAARTGVVDLDIRISNRPFIDVCKPFAAETGLKSRNVEKRINAV
jgi:hypothetical protein